MTEKPSLEDVLASLEEVAKRADALRVRIQCLAGIHTTTLKQRDAAVAALAALRVQALTVELSMRPVTAVDEPFPCFIYDTGAVDALLRLLKGPQAS